MDPIGACVAAVLAVGAGYRTVTRLPGTFTAGLWTAAVAILVGSLVIPLDAALKSLTGLDSLTQPISYSAMVISSYLIAHTTYRIADLNLVWPLVYTVTSIAGMVALYCTTDLRYTQTLAIETLPGAASSWFAIFYAVGLLPTHVAAIIGAVKAKHKDTLMVWLLAIYGGVGALNPVIIVANHVGTDTFRWPLGIIFPLIWVILFISFAALSAAAIIGARRRQRHLTAPAPAPTAY